MPEEEPRYWWFDCPACRHLHLDAEGPVELSPDTLPNQARLRSLRPQKCVDTGQDINCTYSDLYLLTIAEARALVQKNQLEDRKKESSDC